MVLCQAERSTLSARSGVHIPAKPPAGSTRLPAGAPRLLKPQLAQSGSLRPGRIVPRPEAGDQGGALRLAGLAERGYGRIQPLEARVHVAAQLLEFSEHLRLKGATADIPPRQAE